MSEAELYSEIMSSKWETLYCDCPDCGRTWLLATTDTDPHIAIGSKLGKDVAEHIAALHNTWILDIERLTDATG
jgi:hypothetical protein